MGMNFSYPVRVAGSVAASDLAARPTIHHRMQPTAHSSTHVDVFGSSRGTPSPRRFDDELELGTHSHGHSTILCHDAHPVLTNSCTPLEGRPDP